MVKNPYYRQNKGRLPSDPPNYLGKVASEVWRKIVPFLESTEKVERIDAHLIEMYCTNYEIYRNSYDDIKENKIQTPIYKTVQNAAGEAIGQDFIGYKKNGLSHSEIFF